MLPRLQRSGLPMCVLLVLTLGRSVPVLGTDYSIVDLGTLGGTVSNAQAINSSGQVVGSSTIAGDTATHVFLYSGGAMTNITAGTVAGAYGDGQGINDAGHVSGTTIISPYYRAFFWSPGTGVILCGTLIPNSNSYGQVGNLNNSDEVTGVADDSPGGRAFRWTQAGGMVSLGAYPGKTHSYALGINNAGDIVGQAFNNWDVDFLAVRYSGGTWTSLGGLGGAKSAAQDINDSGVIVGSAQIAGGDTHAFMYTGGVMTDLGTLTGGTSCTAIAINNGGVIVGGSNVSGGANHAFIYSGGTMTDLNTLLPGGSGWTLTVARDINDDGQIVGQGVIGGQNHGFLMTPLNPPEVTEHPQAQSACPGADATFTVAATGDGPLSYQWRKDEMDLTDNGHYSGTETDELMVDSVVGADAGDYDCVVTNNSGSVASDPATLIVETDDADNDGTPDCADACPEDPAKPLPGLCGCGTSDDDADADGTPDCYDVDRLLHFQGKLKDAVGAAVNGTREMTFRFYDAETDGNLLFTESHSGVPITRGLFSVILGSLSTGGVPDAAVDRQDAWVSVAVDSGDELAPRSRVPAKPYVTKALAAEKLVKPGTLNPAVTVDSTGQVGIGTTSPGEALHVVGNILATGSITPGSSRTLKVAINGLSSEEAEETLRILEPVKFRYRADPADELHLGFIAEDVPDLVATAGRHGVDPTDIVAVLTKTGQAHQEMIEQLKIHVELLREQVESQQRQIECLQSMIDRDVGGQR